MEKKFWALASNKGDAKILHDTNEKLHDRTIFPWTSLSCSYDTKEELIKAEGILDEPCRECGCLVSTNYVDYTKDALIRENLCFYCYFWKDKLKHVDNPNVARIAGTHYYIDEDRPNAAFKGFGGMGFTIKFNDGRVVTTHNLWCQGDIPVVFRDRLPDNAVFITNTGL